MGENNLVGIDESKEVRPIFLEEGEELEGIKEFGMKNWISFNPQEGVLECKNLDTKFEEIECVIIASRVIYVKKDIDGNIVCQSADRITSQDGKDCSECEDRGVSCLPRWWIAFRPVDDEIVYAHTLSVTGSTNFNRYALRLLSKKLLPSQVVTKIFVEEASRKKTNTVYRRLQFKEIRKL